MNNTKTRNNSFMEIWGTDTYQGLVARFEKDFDARTPAKAVMAVYGVLVKADEISGDTHTEDQQMEAARMIVVEIAGFLVEKTGGGLPAAVEFIAKNPIDAFTKSLELNLPD
jgi:hypothetical protein